MPGYSQAILDWANVYNNSVPIRTDVGLSLTVDSSGFVYSTGSVYKTNTTVELITIKYSPSGSIVWATRGSGLTVPAGVGKGIALDGFKNVYVVAGSIVKYDNNGNIIWNYASSRGYIFVKTDKLNNVYVAGGNSYFCVAKFNTVGSLLWEKIYTDPHDNRIEDMALDAEGNVIVTGSSFTNSTNDDDFLTVKYSTDGNILWAKKYNGIPGDNGNDIAYGIVTDTSNNIYISGWSDEQNFADLFTMKYSPEGNIMWTSSRYPYAVGYDNTIDSLGYIYSVGKTYSPAGYVTIKYDLSGNILWAKTIQAPSGFEPLPRISLDKYRSVYISCATARSGGGVNLAVVKYDNNGNQQWIAEYQRNSQVNEAYDMTVDKNNNVLITGKTGNDFTTIKFSQIISNIISEPSELVKDFKLMQNYPNPFNPSTKIEFEMPASAFVTLKVYDVLGKEITVLINQTLHQGKHSIDFSGSHLASGIYFYRLETDRSIETKKMFLLK